jgi:hypothetical protein
MGMSTGLISDFEIPKAGQSTRPQLFAEYFTEEELAAEFKVTTRTLRLWRMQRRGPPWTKASRKIVYRRQGVYDWIKAQEIQPVRSSRPRQSSTA